MIEINLVVVVVVVDIKDKSFLAAERMVTRNYYDFDYLFILFYKNI